MKALVLESPVQLSLKKNNREPLSLDLAESCTQCLNLVVLRARGILHLLTALLLW